MGKNRQGVIEQIVTDIQSKELNKPDGITLILGNPDNIKDKTHQAVDRKEHDALMTWCGEHDVSVKLHHHSLHETLAEIFKPESVAADTFRMAI